MTREEAEYLRERILTSVPETLLAFLVGRNYPPEQLLFPWELELPGLPAHLEGQLRQARNFSELMHGAALLYNLMVAEASNREEYVQKYEREISAWASTVEGRWDELSAWDLEPFWRLVSSERKGAANTSTRWFVGSWKRLVYGPDGPGGIAADERARDLVRERERRLKKGWARLSNPRAREMWGGASGVAQLNYRWDYAHAILSDIFSGLEADGVA